MRYISSYKSSSDRRKLSNVTYNRLHVEGDVPTPVNPPAGCRFHTRCPIAVEECKQASPPLVELRPGHRVACIRADVTAESL